MIITPRTHPVLPGKNCISLDNSIFLNIAYLSLMKILIILFCLLPSIIINAQIIDYNSFNDERMNEIMFNKIKEYTSCEGGYSLSRSSEKHTKIYKSIKKNNEELLLDDLSAKINRKIPGSSIGIIDSISCKGIKEYQEIASRCITDWTNSPSDAFFMIGWGKVVEVTSYYSNKTWTIYISVVYHYT
jgi:hypothetical protein